jgi:two-component system cell cycle response regulator
MTLSANERLPRIVLVDPEDEGREVLAERLRAQRFIVDTAPDGATGAELALSSPPSALIADLWMPGVSGVQLCRLLRAEPATSHVPLILRSEEDNPKSRFWSERAGAVALVSKGRMGELARVLRRVASAAQPQDEFFMELGGGPLHVRDRIAQHLDTALFESVIAAEIRALASACSFDGLFDSLSQLVAQLMGYHWLALSTSGPSRLAVHGHPREIGMAEDEARAALGVSTTAPAFLIQDKDAMVRGVDQSSPVIVREIPFGGSNIARIAVATTDASNDIEGLVSLIARELGGAIRLATLVEDSQRLATTDSLTGLMNRRAAADAMQRESVRCDRTNVPLSVLLLDVDHFKQVNDRQGHASGDAVLSALGELLPRQARPYDVTARWGGEEFVIALPAACGTDAWNVAERIRSAVETSTIRASNGDAMSVTVSIGVAQRFPGESLDSLVDRADRAMYAAKTSGRNRVCLAPAAETSQTVATVEASPTCSDVHPLKLTG